MFQLLDMYSVYKICGLFKYTEYNQIIDLTSITF